MMFRIVACALALGSFLHAATAAMGRPPNDLPKLLHGDRPLYPASLLASMSQGAVVIQFEIDERGVPGPARVIQASHPDFVPPVVLAIPTWRFEPALQGGVPVRSVRRDAHWFEPGIRLATWAATRSPSSLGNHRFGFKASPPEGPAAGGPSRTAKVLTATNPVYPFELALAGTTGQARVDFSVTARGHPVGVKVVQATEPQFGAALAAMVEACRFEPAAAGEPPVAAMTREHAFSPHAAFSSLDQRSRAILSALRNKSEESFTLSQLDAPPKPLYQPPPAFPGSFSPTSLPGAAEIEFFVDSTGRVQLPRVISATTPEFGWAAATAVQQWFFEIPRRNGKAVVARIRVPLEFIPPDTASQPAP